MASPSLVTEVLAHSGRLEKEDLSTKISRLSQRVEEVKGEVCDMINKKYEEFLPSLQSAEDLVSQVDNLSSDIDMLKSRIENEVQRDLHVAVTEFTELKQQLEKNTVILSVLKELQEFDIAIEKFSCKVSERNYIAAAEHLEKAQITLRALKLRKGSELQVLKGLGIELTLQKENLLYHLGEEWRQLVVWKLPPAKDLEDVKSALKTELHLYTLTPKEESGCRPLLTSVLQAFSIVGELNAKLKFFNVPLELSLEKEKKSKVALAEVLGDMIWKEVSDCIIKDCLVYSIPTNTSMLEQYEEVIQSTEEFENSLKKMKFLKGDATDLLKYARNINAHFASKKCQDVIVMARNLMTTEIHNTVKIIPESGVSVPKLPALTAGDKLKQQKVSKTVHNEMMELANENKLEQHTFALPACRISESVQKLMDLAYQTLSEATSSSTQCAIQLFYTVRNIFHLFHDVVPTYHKENLQKLPQLSAIHHNNCMFIAHHLLTLGHQFKYHLPSPLCDGAATFVDLVPGFRRLGTEGFLVQMRIQKGELLERLANVRNFSNMDDDENYANATKAIRQVLHQLKRLGKVWQDVLPVHVYCKAMGTLLNTAVTEIIGRITALEDISAEDGNKLYALCRLVIEEGPHVFTPLLEENKNKKYQEEVPICVKKWVKFKELMLILQANLQEIVDRWADGKGPLANEFSTSEVKNLMRALFQNTERRAAALAKIK